MFHLVSHLTNHLKCFPKIALAVWCASALHIAGLTENAVSTFGTVFWRKKGDISLGKDSRPHSTKIHCCFLLVVGFDVGGGTGIRMLRFLCEVTDPRLESSASATFKHNYFLCLQGGLHTAREDGSLGASAGCGLAQQLCRLTYVSLSHREAERQLTALPCTFSQHCEAKPFCYPHPSVLCSNSICTCRRKLVAGLLRS